MRSLILSILFFSILGCTTISELPIKKAKPVKKEQTVKDVQPIQEAQPEVDVPVEQVVSNSIELRLNALSDVNKKAEEKGAIFLELGVIPGAIYGAPIEKPRWYFDLNQALKPTLDSVQLEKALKQHATTRVENKFSADLNVQPADTQFVRANTFGVDFQEKKHLSGALVNDEGDFLFLMYFDRACKITGDNNFGKEGIFRHKLDIPKAGVYRVVVRGERGGVQIVTAEQSNEPLIVRIR